MSYQNGIISAPVSIYDVQRALGIDSPDLYTLARNGNIKRLSPYKPIRGNLNGYSDKVGEMSDTDIINRNLGFVLPEFPFTKSATTYDFNTVIKGIIADNIPWSTIPGSSDVDSRGSIGNGWVYNMPVANTHYARLTDFNHYDHGQKNAYENTTFEVLEGTKSVYTGGSYTAKFFVKMSPLAPRNFRTLIGKYLGVAITSPNVQSGAVFFYVGNGSGDFSSISSAAMGVDECSVIMPSTLFDEIVSKCSGQNDIVLNVVGFVAPSSYAGYQNIKSSYSGYQANPNTMNGLIPLPGLDADTIVWHPSLSNICYLQLNGSGSIITPGQTQTTMVIRSVVNTYISSSATTFYLYRYIKYTYDILDANDNVVYSMTTKTSFIPDGQTFNAIDVTNNPSTSANTFDLTDYNITKTLSLPNQSYSVDGYRVLVYLWYLDGVNPSSESGHDYRISGQFFIKIGTPSPFD